MESLSQDYKSLVSSGDGYYEKEQFHSAAQYYQVAVGLRADQAEVNYRLAESYRSIFNYTLAAIYYQQTIQLDAIGYPLASFYLAEMQRATGNFQLALANFEQFIDDNKDNQILSAEDRQKYLAQAEIARQGCEWALEQVNLSWDKIGFRSLPSPVNSEFNDYAPAVGNHDTLLTITSGRKGVKGGLLDNRYGDYFTDNLRFEKSEAWSSATSQDRFDQNNTKFSDGAGTYNADRTKYYFTSCYEGDAYCQLYVTRLENGKWNRPRLLNQQVNAPGYDNRHPALSPSGDTLIFVSNRPGGNGGNDLWITIADGDDNWQAPQKLPIPINTPFNESAPYYHDDGTLFFSSDGHVGLGGMDILMVVDFDSGIKEVKNIGIPFNSGYDDNFFILGKRKGYLSSNRAGGLGKFDIYGFDWPGDEQQSIADFLEEARQEGEQLRSRIQEYNARNLFAARDEDQFYYDNLTAEERAQFDRILRAKNISEGSFDPQTLDPEDFKYYRKLDIETKAIIERLAQRKVLEISGVTNYELPSSLDPLQQSDWTFYQNASAEERAIIDRIIAAKIADRKEFKIADLNPEESIYWSSTGQQVHQRIETKSQIQSIDSILHDLEDVNQNTESRLENQVASLKNANSSLQEGLSYNDLKTGTISSISRVLAKLPEAQRSFFQSLNFLQQDDIHRLALRRQILENNALTPAESQSLLEKYGLTDGLERIGDQYSPQEVLWMEEIVEILKDEGFSEGSDWPIASKQAFRGLTEEQKLVLYLDSRQEVLRRELAQSVNSTEELQQLKSQLGEKIADTTSLDAQSNTLENNIANKLTQRYLGFVPSKLAPREAYYFRGLSPQNQLRIERLSIMMTPSETVDEKVKLEQDFVTTLSSEDRDFLTTLSTEKQQMAEQIIAKGVSDVSYSEEEMEFMRGLDHDGRQQLDKLANSYQSYRSQQSTVSNPDLAFFESTFLNELIPEERKFLQDLNNDQQQILHNVVSSQTVTPSMLTSKQVEFLSSLSPQEQQYVDHMIALRHPENPTFISWNELTDSSIQTDSRETLDSLFITTPDFQQKLTMEDRQFLEDLSHDELEILNSLVLGETDQTSSTSAQMQWLGSLTSEERLSIQRLQSTYQRLNEDPVTLETNGPLLETQDGPIIYFDFDRYALRPEARKELQDFFNFVPKAAAY
ncbi:MAG: hypothetical protein OER04_13075, partial [Cyclobacteriaceae bacterium]|nr:hypothetical protein [Cyclobacteriaceae bacterium]